ncbi:hypothetical protein [Antiquaquibacter soli]|uniref:Uncharacterized protein n=1 Tax=Antiquaquibacter soli TaxID=3064523 RepID=A0ABT9BR35_9MICO|nr:hypothetical protein [Protaetiibacter sp. WY-16]MDO7881787.1 hypothetical protein [Protaetiibacter sp. WY-16]
MPTEVPGISRTSGAVSLSYYEETGIGPALIEGGLFREILVWALSDADALVPPGVVWRIHFTGDMVTSVAELNGTSEGETYTLDRGANVVAGKTIKQPDGSFDVVVSFDVWNVAVSEDIDHSVQEMALTLRHTLMHEAGHVAIDARGEDALDLIDDVDGLDRASVEWARHLGFMLEDYRIELALHSLAPNQIPRVSMISEDLALFDAERSRSQRVGAEGRFVEGREVMLKAMVDLTRVLAYLAAECVDPVPTLVGADLERWNRFVAPTWESWVAAYGAALPATQPMARTEIIEIIRTLSRLAPAMLSSVGFERTFEGDNEAVWWLRSFEW